MANIVFLGWLADYAGTRDMTVDVTQFKTVEELRRAVSANNPELAFELSKPSVQVIIDKTQRIDGDLPDSPITEIIFMPPLAGG